MSYLQLLRDPLVVLAPVTGSPNSWGQSQITFADSYEVKGNVQTRQSKEIVGPNLGADVIVQTKIFLPFGIAINETDQIRAGYMDTNEVQSVSITGSPTGGMFELGSGMDVTDPIDWNANAAAVQAALVGMLGAGNATVTGTNPNFTVTFTGSLEHAAQPLLTLALNLLTGGASPSVAVVEVTEGHAAVAGVGYRILSYNAPQMRTIELSVVEIRTGEIPGAPVNVQ